MRKHTMIRVAAAAILGGCAGTQADANEAQSHQQEKTAGDMATVQEERPEQQQGEPVVVAEADLDANPGSSNNQQGADACVPLTVYFSDESDELDAQAEQALEQLSDCLEQHESVTVQVVGHVDPDTPDSLDAQLATQRMAKVEAHLDEADIDRDRYIVRYSHEDAAAQ